MSQFDGQSGSHIRGDALDEDGHPFDIRVRAEREAAEREFCSCCFPGWFKNGGTTKTA